MFKEHSYGIIPLQNIDNRWQVLIIKHQAGHWAYPKGKSDPGESPLETAEREMAEETGLEVVRLLSNDPLEEHYHFNREGIPVEKTVAYFIAEVKGEVSLQTEEVEDSKWVPLENAEEYVTFPEAKKLTCSLRRQFSAQENGS